MPPPSRGRPWARFVAIALASPLASANFGHLYNEQDLSQVVCQSRSVGGGLNTIYCMNSDKEAGGDFVQDCTTPDGVATTREDKLYLDFANAVTGHNNMAGNGCGYDGGDKGPYACKTTDSTACALCGSGANMMNHGVCANRDGQAYGAGEWAQLDCADFAGNPWYDMHRHPDGTCWFSTVSGAGTVNGAVPGAPGISDTTGRSYSGKPTPRYGGDWEGKFMPYENGGSDGTNNARKGKLDDMCYEGSMLMNVVGNVKPGQRVDLWLYPGKLEQR